MQLQPRIGQKISLPSRDRAENQAPAPSAQAVSGNAGPIDAFTAIVRPTGTGGQRPAMPKFDRQYRVAFQNAFALRNILGRPQTEAAPVVTPAYRQAGDTPVALNKTPSPGPAIPAGQSIPAHLSPAAQSVADHVVNGRLEPEWSHCFLHIMRRLLRVRVRPSKVPDVAPGLFGEAAAPGPVRRTPVADRT